MNNKLKLFDSQKQNNNYYPNKLNNQSNLKQQRHTLKKTQTLKNFRFQQQQSKDTQQYETQLQRDIVRTCRKLTLRQLDNYHRSSVRDLKIQFQKMKTKMKSKGKFNNNNGKNYQDYQVLKIFQNPIQQTSSALVKKIYKKSQFKNTSEQHSVHNSFNKNQQPLDVFHHKNKFLQQKINFNSHKSIQKILRKKQIYDQIQKIQDKKIKYNKWYNNFNNSPLQSPIYNRMLYLFEKIKKNNLQNSFDQLYDPENKISQSFFHKKQTPNVMKNQRIYQQIQLKRNFEPYHEKNIKKNETGYQNQDKTSFSHFNSFHNSLINKSSLNFTTQLNQALKKLSHEIKYKKKIKKQFNLKSIDTYKSVF